MDVTVAELRKLESKLGEVMGLATAARAATERVQALLGDGDSGLAATLNKLNQEASETETRCLDVAANFEGKKSSIQEQARSTSQKGAEMLKSYLDPNADALDGFEFLTIIEAAEVGHWNVLKVMNDRAGDQAITELVTWALPIQERHYSDASESAKQLAADTDPAQPA
jgi:hypothetical protein